MTVINIADYRPPEKMGGGTGTPCTITFMGFNFWTPEGEQKRLSVSIDLGDGDFEGMIDYVRQQGGIYLPTPEEDANSWFLPWPCAAVRVSPTP
jgi:hypothetical protein